MAEFEVYDTAVEVSIQKSDFQGIIHTTFSMRFEMRCIFYDGSMRGQWEFGQTWS